MSKGTERPVPPSVNVNSCVEKNELIPGIDMYGQIVENLGDVVWILSSDINTTYVSPSIKKLTGFTAEEVMKRDPVNLITPDSLQGFIELLDKIAVEKAVGDSRAGKVWTVELEMFCRDGSTTWIEMKLELLRDSEGGLLGLLGISRDINRRRKVENTLRVTEKKFRNLYELSIDGVFLIGVDGRLIDANKAFLEMVGYSREEVEGIPACKIIPDLPQGKKGEYTTPPFLLNWSNEEVETGFVRKDGVVVPVRLKAWRESDKDGKPIGLWVISRDMTGGKNQEGEYCEAREAAESASRGKCDLLASMSHEIKESLGGVLKMNELLLQSRLTAEQRECSEAIQDSADALLEIINDILDFSRIEAGRIKLKKVPFNLPDVIGETLRTFTLRAYEKNIELIYRVEPDVPYSLVGDPDRLQQVIVNLVDNAIKFTNEGEVLVSIGVALKTDTEAVLEFSVRDTGVGISAARREAVFKPFTRPESSLKRKYVGTGLGLAISSRLAEMMDGGIWFEGEENAGTDFHFTAKFGLRACPSHGPVAGFPFDLKNIRVLVVDDNKTVCESIEDLLLSWEIRSVTANDGAEAISALLEGRESGDPFDLVISDATMSPVDGFELVDTIKLDPELDCATVMMLSSPSLSIDIPRLEELGVGAYLTKPITPSELLDSIMTAISEPAREPFTSMPPEKKERFDLGVNILLAEDNKVNQMLISRLLERKGGIVDVAGNGREVLDALEIADYDLILMDVQMPEVNGFEATAEIRNRESLTDRHTYIVAMTAHAMKGDRERCIYAGMDDYIAKPVKSEELCRVVEKSVARTMKMNSEHGKDKQNYGKAVDIESALEAVGGHEEILVDMIKVFIDDYPLRVENLRKAIRGADCVRVRSCAHGLRGNLVQVMAYRAGEIAEQLEMMGKVSNISGAEKLIPDFDMEMDKVGGELREFLNSRDARGRD